MSLALPAATRVCALAFVMKKEVANNDDVDDVDLECRWHSTYNSADRGNREVAEKISISAAKKVDLDINMPANANALVTRNRSTVPHFTLQRKATIRRPRRTISPRSPRTLSC